MTTAGSPPVAPLDVHSASVDTSSGRRTLPSGPPPLPPLPPPRTHPLRTAGVAASGVALVLLGALLAGWEALVRADVVTGDASDLRPLAAWWLGLLGALLLTGGLWVTLRRLDTVLIARLPEPPVDPGTSSTP